MRVRFHPEAETEMIEAAVYYEDRQADLGKRFLASVQDAINNIVINPPPPQARSFTALRSVQDDKVSFARGRSPNDAEVTAHPVG